MTDDERRAALVLAGRLLVERRLVHGTTGNLSLRAETGFLLTPTGSALDRLDPRRLAHLSPTGERLGGDAPTKEFRLHQALYAARPSAQAVVHTHSTHCVAVSMLDDVDRADMLPPLTPYYVMRVGRCPVSPYRLPGDARLAADVGDLAPFAHVMVLAHHGPVCAGSSLDDAIATLEELEETARVYLLLRGQGYRALEPPAVDELRARFPAPLP